MTKIYGYCRISTARQSIDRQIRNIKGAYPDAVIVQEVFSGRKSDRPEWVKLQKVLQEGDTVVFDSVSRMSRNAEEGIQKYMELYNKGINLMFLKEPAINTTTYKDSVSKQLSVAGGDKITDLVIEFANKLIVTLAEQQIRLAFDQAQKEVDDLSQRTKEGLVTAQLNGKQVGRELGAGYTTKKEIEAKEIIKKHSKDFGGSLADDDCRKLAEVSRNTYYKYKKELKEKYNK